MLKGLLHLQFAVPQESLAMPATMGMDQKHSDAAPAQEPEVREVLEPSSRQYICACRLTTDFFVHGVDRYYEYDGNDTRFFAQYQAEVDKGIMSQERLQSVLQDVKSQSRERVLKFEQGTRVHQNIAATYKPLHPDLRVFNKDFLHPSFLEVVQHCRRLGSGPFDSETLKKAGFEVFKKASNTTTGVVTLRHIFTEDFVERLTAELIHFAASGIAYTPPNTMNRNGGVLLYEIGFQEFLDHFIPEYMNPVAKVVVPDDFQGGDIDSHKVFTVAYQSADEEGREGSNGKRRKTLREGPSDQKLSVHTDNSEATLNLHLAGDWTGGDLNVYGKGSGSSYAADLQEVYKPERKKAFGRTSGHSQGLALFHAGSEFHEALPVTSGWRLNLIMWLRSSKVRNEQCPMCNKPPSLVQIDSLAGEGFTSPPCEMSTHVKLTSSL